MLLITVSNFQTKKKFSIIYTENTLKHDKKMILNVGSTKEPQTLKAREVDTKLLSGRKYFILKLSDVEKDIILKTKIICKSYLNELHNYFYNFLI